MPYKVGAKGSHGCSGFPVVDDNGKAVGCHPSRSKAVNHLQALYANVPDASKADTPMDVAYNATVTDPTPANPSSHINPAVGMKKPQILNFGRQVGPGIHDKRIVDIVHVPFLGKFDGSGQEVGSYMPPIPSPVENTEGIIEQEDCMCEECMGIRSDMSAKSLFADFAKNVNKPERVTNVFS